MKLNKKKWVIMVASLVAVVVVLRWSYFSLPVNRVGIRSDLIMLGDLNNDKTWNEKDKKELSEILLNPFKANRVKLLKVDVNKNQIIDMEDTSLLGLLYKYEDPYVAGQAALKNNIYFPRPRELFKYLPSYEYIQPPFVTVSYNSDSSPFKFISTKELPLRELHYRDQLKSEIVNEAYRFMLAYTLRKDSLTIAEKENFNRSIVYCNELYDQQNHFELLLQLISLVEEIETLDPNNQTEFVQKLLPFRDHLRALLKSSLFRKFKNDSVSYQVVFSEIERHLKTDLGIELKIDSMGSPRDFSKIENYISRAEWQKNKSLNKKEDFMKLLLYAQYDKRYLRAVSRTSQKDQDLELNNHNLPMLLLFHEGLRIKHGDKKATIGLLDEAIRVPFSWVKSIPREMLPSSIALENFLLPGNKEDGSDKSRHWNVFGGVSLYKSPEESLILSFQREVVDAREGNYSYNAVREFIRDLIANTNGIYHVVSANQKLVYENDEQ
jgi:hypothetical protein